MKLYKFMSLNAFKDFLKDPCLRVTPSYCQNDPFEFGYTDKDLNYLDNITPKLALGKNLREYSYLHGIVSLTSTSNNTPMWSHYADNHTGVAVELIVDSACPQSLFVNSQSPIPIPSHTDLLFRKVTYSTTRGLSNLEKLKSIDKIKEHYYFNKSKSWEYENEYRFIIPLTWINKIILNTTGRKKAEKLLGKYGESIEPISKQLNYERYQIPPAIIELIIIENCFLLAELWRACNKNEAMFFARLNTGVPGFTQGNVGPVYLGYSADTNSFINYLKNECQELNTLSILNHYYCEIKGESNSIYQATIDSDRYELLFDEVKFCMC